MKIVVEPKSFYVAKSGAVVGEIWLRLESPPLAFPQDGWTDFPVVVLGWWLHEVEALIQKASIEARCLFMDGPFEFALNGSGEVRMGERRAEKAIEIGSFPYRVSVEEFWKSLTVAAGSVIAECHARGWSSGDIDTLRRFVT